MNLFLDLVFVLRRKEYSDYSDHLLLILQTLKYTTHRIAFPGDCQQARLEMNAAWVADMRRGLNKSIEAWKAYLSRRETLDLQRSAMTTLKVASKCCV